MKYKIGDKVKIREDLVAGEMYGTLSLFSGKMEEIRGRTYIVNNISNSGNYILDRCGFFISEKMIEGLAEDINKKEKCMKDFKIVDYKVCDNNGVKTVVVKFEDGTDEHAVCCAEDNFELERGIEVCVMKHIFGRDNYKAMLRTSMKQVKAIDKAKEDKKKAEAAEKARKAKIEARKAKRREKKRNERIGEMIEAYVNAMMIVDEIYSDECDCGCDCECCYEDWDNLK